MVIEVAQPELERLIRERMETGRFGTVEEVLLDALRTTAAEKPSHEGQLPLGQFLLNSPLRGSGLEIPERSDFPTVPELFAAHHAGSLSDAIELGHGRSLDWSVAG